jgi:hypothetical protein
MKYFTIKEIRLGQKKGSFRKIQVFAQIIAQEYHQYENLVPSAESYQHP